MIAALTLGLYAGLAPGPTLTLVIGQTLRHGVGEGLKVACAPLVTDLPIVALSLVVLARLDDSDRWLGTIGLVGAAILVLFAIDCFRAQPPEAGGSSNEVPRSLLKGALANALNPHPWVAWMTVLGPMLTAAWSRSRAQAVLFVILFYATMVGSKMVVALLVARGRGRLAGRGWRIVMLLLGLILLIFAAKTALDGWQRLTEPV